VSTTVTDGKRSDCLRPRVTPSLYDRHNVPQYTVIIQKLLPLLCDKSTTGWLMSQGHSTSALKSQCAPIHGHTAPKADYQNCQCNSIKTENVMLTRSMISERQSYLFVRGIIGNLPVHK
jgi:hypothetical protein